MQIRLATFNANNVYDGHDDPDKRDGRKKDPRGLMAVTEILRDGEADVEENVVAWPWDEKN